jgi:RNA polymerase sigma-70 factor (ECF subfamily)
VVDAFFLASREGNFDALVNVLDPDVVLRIDAAANAPVASMVLHGAAAVARQTLKGMTSSFARPGVQLHSAVVNGAAGMVITVSGQPFVVMGFTIAEGKIVEIDSIADPERVRRFATAFVPNQEIR